jgi:hypothetical protein
MPRKLSSEAYWKMNIRAHGMGVESEIIGSDVVHELEIPRCQSTFNMEGSITDVAL